MPQPTMALIPLAHHNQQKCPMERVMHGIPCTLMMGSTCDMGG